MQDPTPQAIDAQEQVLTLRHFDALDAWWLGCHLREQAMAAGAPVAIDIRRGDTRLFSALMPGATQDNLHWTARKIALAMRFERSSYAMALMFAAREGAFERFGLDWATYAPAGGAVPIRLTGGTVIGAVAISGLPQQDVDHAMVVNALAALQAHQQGASL